MIYESSSLSVGQERFTFLPHRSSEPSSSRRRTSSSTLRALSSPPLHLLPSFPLLLPSSSLANGFLPSAGPGLRPLSYVELRGPTGSFLRKDLTSGYLLVSSSSSHLIHFVVPPQGLRCGSSFSTKRLWGKPFLLDPTHPGAPPSEKLNHRSFLA